jgi:putative transcriptional regulator
MAKRNIAAEILQGLEEVRGWQKGEVKLKSLTVELPKAADVPVIRKRLGYSQPALASLMGVSLGTLRNWEQQRREPQGAARALLLIAATHPEAVKDTMQKLTVAKKAQRLVKRAPIAKRVKAARLAKETA